jgi:hypothetical protein
MLHTKINNLTFYSKPKDSESSPQEYVFDLMKKNGYKVMLKYGNYSFSLLPNQDELAEYILDTDESERVFYEVLTGPQWMFADLDGSVNSSSDKCGVDSSIDKCDLDKCDLDKCDLDKYEAEVCDVLIKVLTKAFSILNVTFDSNKARWLSASKGDKLSIHFSYPFDYSFENHEAQKKFWIYVDNMIKSSDINDGISILKKVIDKDDKIICNTLIDLSVYSSNRPMRFINCHKENSDRVLLPFKLIKVDDSYSNSHQCGLSCKKIKPGNIIQYFINAIDHKHHYTIDESDSSLFDKLKFNIDKPLLKELIKTKIPNTKLNSIKGSLVTLSNTGIRKCIINGEDNKTDNCFMVFRADGIYFGCHDTGCKEQYKLIHSFKEKVSTLDHKTDSKEVNYYYDDYSNLCNKIVCTAKEVDDYFRSTHTYIKKGSYYMIKNLDEDDVEICYPISNEYSIPKQKIVTIDGKPHNLRNLFDSAVERNIIKEYSFTNYIPYFRDSPCSNRLFNMFRGFSRLDKKFNYNQEKLNIILYHVKEILCNNVPENYNYLINYYAHMIQKPNDKISIAIVHRSGQGAGKSSFYEKLGDLFDKHNSIVISSTEQLLGKFNTYLMNKMLVILDEISNYGAAFKSNDQLKNIISGKNIKIEPKGKEAFLLNNPTRYIFLSNNDFVVKVEGSDRRYFICDVNNKHANDRKYFNKLFKAMDDEGLNTLFKYLSEINIEDWDYTSIPNDEARTELKLMSIPSPIRFVINMLEDNTKYVDFDDYKFWCEKNNENYKDYTKFTFNSFLKKKLNLVNGLVKDNGKVSRKFNITNVLEDLRIYIKDPKFNITVTPRNEDDDEKETIG